MTGVGRNPIVRTSDLSTQPGAAHWWPREPEAEMLHGTCRRNPTVDGQNPAPLGNRGTQVSVGIYRGIIIPGFLRWCRNLSIHSINDLRGTLKTDPSRLMEPSRTRHSSLKPPGPPWNPEPGTRNQAFRAAPDHSGTSSPSAILGCHFGFAHLSTAVFCCSFQKQNG